ncbi:ATP-binding protein [Marinimicrobium sp. ABcell2]|uniref:sensor histidine kinase n=1 Tax=Marinimicrobium sp. ABcell2 TaxID=3069751 RepID=UPI0027B7E3B5|nr:ATP-binding protein [Marinimicrobium sp. ABcell2]MDQ2076590.1 ATP-binding protein [Marinimicrobium sp. ABcell2]
MGFPRFLSLHNIRTALLIFVLVPFLLVMVISAGFSLHRLEQAAEAGLQDDIELIARSIHRPLSHALEHDLQLTLRRTVSSAGEIGRVYGVYVYDRDGKRISAEGPRKIQVQDIEAATLATEGSERGAFDEVEGEQVFSYFMPLTDSGGRINGLLQVTRRGSDFAHQIGEFRTRALLVLSGSALLVLILVWLGYQRAIGRHIQGMGKSMAHIAGGDMHHRLQSKGPTEIRYLAEGVNRMLDSILDSEREISARRDRENDLKTQLHQSEKLAAIGRFAAGVAHELGTPLSVADGKAQRALRTVDAEDAQPLNDIRQQLYRMERIIRQLMDFARPVVPDHRDMRADDLVQSSLQQVEDERLRQDVQILIDKPGDCPPIYGDRLRLEQALINLLRNAIQATPSGTVRLNWHCDDQENLVLCVEDDGPGIEEKVRSRLLEPFVTTKPVGVGTGLGLAVVNAVVAEHGGQIHIDQSPLGGARFQITLPLRRQTEEGKS